MDNQGDEQWLAVCGRALAFMCLIQEGLRDKGIAQQASFLDVLGLPRKDVALLLGTSEKTITEVLSRERRKIKESRGGKNKGSQK
ncbi:MAG TPA: hypothetical protein VF553_19490 [Pyrinomonadaceae bacterium]|jgi:hypothetical protein